MTTRTSSTTARWTRWHSDAGRSWATRTEPYTPAQANEGCALTVDADTDEELEKAIAAQEQRAQEVPDRAR